MIYIYIYIYIYILYIYKIKKTGTEKGSTKLYKIKYRIELYEKINIGTCLKNTN